MQTDTSMRVSAQAAFKCDAESIATGDWLWLTGSLAQMHRQPFDAERVARQYPAPHSVVTLREALTALRMRSDWRRFDVRHAMRTALPAVAFLRPRADAPGNSPAQRVPVILVKTDGERLLYFRAGSNVAETVVVGRFDEHFEPRVLPVARERDAPATEEAGPTDDAPRADRFGYRWFVPELLRHKRAFRDVLLASLAIQLMGLATRCSPRW